MVSIYYFFLIFFKNSIFKFTLFFKIFGSDQLLSKTVWCFWALVFVFLFHFNFPCISIHEVPHSKFKKSVFQNISFLFHTLLLAWSGPFLTFWIYDQNVRNSDILTIFPNRFKQNCQKFLHFCQNLITPSVGFLTVL